MTDQTTTTQDPPAEWTTSYLDPSGFECQLTLRAQTGADLLKRAAGALLALTNAGCTPAIVKPVASATTSTCGIVSTTRTMEAPKMPDGSPDPTWCPIHGVSMSRHEKNGEAWFSHKTDGGYCRGK